MIDQILKIISVITDFLLVTHERAFLERWTFLFGFLEATIESKIFLII